MGPTQRTVERQGPGTEKKALAEAALIRFRGPKALLTLRLCGTIGRHPFYAFRLYLLSHQHVPAESEATGGYQIPLVSIACEWPPDCFRIGELGLAFAEYGDPNRTEVRPCKT